MNLPVSSDVGVMCKPSCHESKISLASLPAPQKYWLWNKCFDKDIGVLDPDTLDIWVDLDTLVELLKSMGFTGVCSTIH